VVWAAATACAPATESAPAVSALHAGALRANADPTVRFARLVPESLDLPAVTVEPSGSVRGIVHGARFRLDTHRRLRTATDRIPDASLVVPVPARLGGGFLFVVGDMIYAADDWLAPPRPLFRSSRGIVDVFVGLDRVYLRTKAGAHVAFDPRTGARLDLGPWPADPFVGAYVPLDGWRAVALTDVRGAVGTLDAGRTWTPLHLPIRPRTLTPVRRDGETGHWVEVPPDMSAEAVVVSDGPLHAAAPDKLSEARAPLHCSLVSDSLVVSALPACGDVMLAAPQRALDTDTSPLRAALEDGWPLQDRTAIVAAHGDVLRVSLDDGSIVETATNAFERDLGRCHAVSLARPAAPASFGFVCKASARGTALLAYDETEGRLRAVREFATPRLVESPSNGTWLVHGPCGEGPVVSAATYCIGLPTRGAGPLASYTWREARVADEPGAVVTVTTEGNLVQISPQGSFDDAHLTSVGPDGIATHIPLHLSDASVEVRRIVEHAVWLNGLEERRAGVLSGWIASEGTVIGVEVDADGAMRLGGHVRDLGSPFVAGRYGLGWSRAHNSYETTDGGMTWTPFSAPSPLAPSDVRACGPVGCIADGWLRVGWGERPTGGAPTVAPSPPLQWEAPRPFSLTCNARPVAPELSFDEPEQTRSDHLFHADIFGAAHSGAVGRIFAWGPASTDWSGQGRWVVRWRSPFGGKAATASSLVAAAPFQDADDARNALGVGRTGPVSFTAVVSEDAAHLLLRIVHPGRTTELATLDAGGTFAPVRRADGAAWSDIDDAIRVGPDWFIASPTDARRSTIDVFRATDGVARRVVSVERLLSVPSARRVRLARGAGGDGRAALGMIVEGEPAPERAAIHRWVIPIDPSAGTVDAPQPLGAADLSDRSHLTVCDERAAAAWVFDTSWPNPNISVDLADHEPPVFLHRVYARLRLSADRACVLRLEGEIEDEAPSAAGRPAARRTVGKATLPVTLVTAATGPSLVECASGATK
jgi:hypothetical protein